MSFSNKYPTPTSPRIPESPGAENLHERHRRKTTSSSSISTSGSFDVPTPPLKITRDYNALIKYGSLLLLVGQMLGLVLLMRYTRTHTVDSQLYLASTAVFMMEMSKFTLCTLIIFWEKQWSVTGLMEEIRKHTLGNPGDMLKLCVPSLLYTIQNNLLYVALTNLDAATYQILYQLKILTTAVFSKTMLGRQFSMTKWLSLVVLTAGVAVVQLSGSGDSSSKGDDADKNRAIGLTAVLCAACTSGFSGVYFEKILKGSDVSVFVRNIQMGIPSMIVALCTCYINDGVEIQQKGFFIGYNSIVWCVILVQAIGGLIVAVVVKYADNVLKVFASSFSIIFSCLISAILFDFRPNALFLVGAGFVCFSTVLYSRPEKRGRQVLPVVNGSGRR
jgi:UDP-sugar transporter A1/2/3